MENIRMKNIQKIRETFNNKTGIETRRILEIKLKIMRNLEYQNIKLQ